jgi:hypothetical protein
MHAYVISLTDGTSQRRTLLFAPDIVFAQMKAVTRFDGTKWQVVDCSEPKFPPEAGRRSNPLKEKAPPKRG